MGTPQSTTTTRARAFLWALALLAASQLSYGARAAAHYTLEIEDEFGTPLPTFQHRGQTWALGRFGQRYRLRVRNHTGRRVEAVISVDGRDVISGQVADFHRLRGYVIAPYSSVVVEGFRTSLSSVAAFRFTDPGDSYSARMGTPENVGVIGAAFFPERVAPRPPPAPIATPREAPPEVPRKRARRTRAGRRQARPRSEALRASGSGGAAEADDRAASNLGTAYGEATHSAASEVPFVRARRHRPARVLTVRYDDRQGLQARGISTGPRPARRPPPWGPPQAFPPSRFAPPPPRD